LCGNDNILEIIGMGRLLVGLSMYVEVETHVFADDTGSECGRKEIARKTDE